MKRVLTTAALAVIAGSLAFGSAASAQNYHHGDRGYHGGHDRGGNHHDNGGWDRHDRDRHDGDWDRRGGGRDRYDRDGRNYGYHRDRGYHNGWHQRSEWRRGGYVSRYDYDRGRYVDYRSHRRLYAPPYGYEWRRVDDNYILVAIASGLIASIILDNY